MVASSAHAATSTITEAVAPSELLSSSTVTAKANAVMATNAFSLIQGAGSATLNSVSVVIVDPNASGLTSSSIASISLRKESGATAGFQVAQDLAVTGASTSTPAIGSPVTLTPTTPETIGTSTVQYYIVVTIAASPTNNHSLAVNFGANYGIDNIGGTVGSALSATKKVTIDIVAPSPAPSAADYMFAQSPPGTPDQIMVRPGVSVGTAGDTVKIYAADGTTLLGSGALGGSPVQFAPISIDDNANASVNVEFVDAAGNASAQAAVTGNDIVAPTVTSALAFTDRIIIQFSEQVDGMQAMNCAPNYIINGTSTICGGMGLPFVDFSGTKITIRGLTLSSTVSFSIPTSTTITDLGGANNKVTAYSSSSMPVQVLTLPSITSISPQSGAVGATTTITGTNFGALGEGAIGDANHKVFFSGGFSQQTGPLPPVEADYTGGSWSNTSIVVKVPSGAQGGPVNVLSGGVMSDMGPNTFFDIAGSYTAKVYYSAGTSTLMDDADNGNIRIVIGGMNGETIYSVGDGFMTYNSSTDTFSIAGVSSMGYTWAYDITGTHLNASGKEVSTAALQNLFMPATTRKISGTITLGASCASGGQNKKVVVFAMPDQVNSGDSSFKQVEPAFFTTDGSCVASYAVGVPMNGTYRVEAHIPPSTSGGITVSTAFTDPDAQSVTISSSTLTAVKNFTFGAATHRIVGTVQKPSGQFGSEERGKLWVFAYQPNGGKGTGAQVTASSTFTLNVSKGVWKIGVGGDNMPFPVEVQVDVDDTYEIADPPKGPTIIIAPPSDFMEGYVKDAAGNGLSGVSLYAWLEGGPGNGNARTDSQGYYKMYVAPGANYHVGANSQSYGFLGEQSNIAVTSSTHPTVNFTVSSSDNYTISGTVTKGGTGLQQAFVFITEGERGAMLGSGGTDSSGAYSARVSGGANRWIHVGLPAKGEVYKANLGTISTSTTSNIAILSSTITVRVSPASDFSQAFVGAHSNDQGGGFSDVDVAAASSSYREYQIDVQRPGSGGTTYYVDGGIPGFGPLSQNSIVVNSDGTFTETSGTANDGIIEYTLSGLYSVSGTVTGDSVNGAWVWVAGPNGGGGAQTADDGTYTLKLKNGTYDIGVGKPNYIGNKISITVNNAPLPGQDLTLTSAGQTITGTVYLPDGVTTVTNAWVWAQNNTGGWSGGSTDANGAYSLNVGSGSWDVQAAYDGYNSSSTSATAPATGVNITLSTISGFSSNLKNSPITPSSGGIVQESGIKVDFPKNALGTDSSAGTVEVKNTTNIPTVASTKVIGNARDITARNSSNQNITTLSGNITIELTVTKAEIEAQGLSFTQVQGMKISYWDSTASNWVEISTSVKLHPATATSIAGLDSDPAVTLSGTVAHLSSFAPTVPADDAPATPTGLTATRDSSRPTQVINLAWTAVGGATSYDIYRNTTSTGSFPRIGSEPTVSSGVTTTYSDTGLAVSTTYYYKISALNSSGESAATVTPVSASTTAASAATGSLCTGLNCPVEGMVIAAPTASPAAGTHTSAQSVTLTATGSNSIRYTTDGTTPTCSTGTAYSSAISISSSATVKAIACYANSNASDVASFAYTISIPATTGNSNSGGGSGGGGWSVTPTTTATPTTTPTATTPPTTTTPTTTTGTSSVVRQQQVQLLNLLVLQLQTLLVQAKAQGINLPAATEQAINTLTTPATTPTIPSTGTFTRELETGMTGNDVKQLQIYLNAKGFKVSASGLGSPGNETSFFGAGTRGALARFQAANGISPAVGYFGPKTMAYVNANP